MNILNLLKKRERRIIYPEQITPQYNKKYLYKEDSFLVTVKSEDSLSRCRNCYFYNKRCFFINCSKEVRKDNRDVYFKQASK